MKLTLLEMVMRVLNAADGDEINSISDTIEALETATDIQTVYYDIIGRKDWQFLRVLTTLNSVGDSEKPTHLLIPENTSKIEVLNYNKRQAVGGRNLYSEVYYKYPDEFLIYTNGRDATQPQYDEITDVNGAKFVIKNDAQPTYFTSFDDEYIIMDAYDGDVENTLQGSQTQAVIFKHPVWSVDDNFTPELPAEMFPMFLAECMSFKLAKEENRLIQKTEQTAGRHQRHLSQTHGVVQGGVRLPDYGRSPRKASSTKTRSAIFGPRS